MERRLTAILAADVVGYSSLMAADEEGTLRRLTALRERILKPLIADHRGRIVKLIGDGLLVEFVSIVEAVTCAVAWQKAVTNHEDEKAEDGFLSFRIGVNLGDVIVDGEDIYGDGVNVAARLEGLADPGGVCVSGDAYRQVRGKIEAEFEDLGERELKNLPEPLRVYRIAMERRSAAVASLANKPPSLPDKPSIAVLPFTNMSADPEQGFFSDGITNDIITELSRFRSLFVIARNSSFHYKGQSSKIQEIGRDLGVHYVVEGSVRRAANRIRITAQLIETARGNHLWAERYDRDLEDIFAVQDELVRTIVATVGGRIDVDGKARGARLSPEGVRAYDLYLRAAAAEDRNTKEDYRQARQHLERAIDLDPGLASAYHHLSLVNFIEWMAHWVDDRDHAFASAIRANEQAIALDDTDSRSHAHLGILNTYRRMFDEAGQNFEKAIWLNPNDYQAISQYGLYLTAIGDPDHAISQFDQAIRLNPLEPSWIRWFRGIACFTAEQYENAIADLRSIKRPINEVRGWLAASLAKAGRLDEARIALQDFLHNAKQELAAFPGTKLEAWKPYWHAAIEYRNDADFDRLYDGLRKAGME